MKTDVERGESDSPQVKQALAAEALRDVPILEMILRARTAGVTREEIKRLLLFSEREVEDYLNGKETPRRFGLHKKQKLIRGKPGLCLEMESGERHGNQRSKGGIPKNAT